MEYMSGLCLASCFEQLTYEQKRRIATDMAEIMFSLFNITSAPCASISPYTGDSFQSNESLCHNSLCYPPFTLLFSLRPSPTLKGQSVIVGPINDLTFLDYLPPGRPPPVWTLQLRMRLYGSLRLPGHASNVTRREAQLLGV